jgi:hypothetical protein
MMPELCLLHKGMGVQSISLCAYFTRERGYKTIVSHTSHGLANETEVNKQSVQTNNYWSSTAVSSLSGNAWNVNMNNGNVNNDNTGNNNLVWPVRGGEW